MMASLDLSALDSLKATLLDIKETAGKLMGGMQTLTDALMQTWAERDKLTAAVKNAPPADGTKRVLEMIEEVQTRKA